MLQIRPILLKRHAVGDTIVTPSRDICNEERVLNG